MGKRDVKCPAMVVSMYTVGFATASFRHGALHDQLIAEPKSYQKSVIGGVSYILTPRRGTDLVGLCDLTSARSLSVISTAFKG